MGYIEKGYLAATEWWRYILALLVMFLGIALFSIPHGMAIANKTALGEVDISRLEDVSYLITLFDSNTNLMYMMLPFVGGFLFLMFAVKYIQQQSIVNLTTSREEIDWRRVFFSFGLWGLIVALFVSIQYFLEPESLVMNFNLKPFLVLCVLGVLLVPIQTSFEEYLFRGYLMQSLGLLAKNRWFPLVFTSVVFGVMHISNPEIAKLGYGLLVYYVGTGFFLGIITLMDEGMELGLGFHAANNLISALLVTSDWQVFQTYSIFKDISEPNLIIAIVPSLLLFPVMLFVFSKKYNWSDWKEKLTGVIAKPTQENSNAI
jgi:membrane protease YdiL (CAAX protease family)